MSKPSAKMRKVLRYLPEIRDNPEPFVAGDGIIAFMKACYDAGLVVPAFDWMQWTSQAQQLVERPELVESADLETITKLLTAHVRHDRFCDNHLASMILNGHIALVLERLRVLMEDRANATPGLRVCIHRGAHQIGGSCVELECQGKRLVLDIGMPLDAADPDTVEMPDVAGFAAADPSLLGIVISHPHQDHYGLAGRVPAGTTFLMGEATERILAAAADFTPSGGRFAQVIHLKDRCTVLLGPFRITPFLMDHSAYDAYAILVEADGRSLFYTGDLRGHGRKAKLFECLLGSPPEAVDVLLMEGTTITRSGSKEGFPTESALEMDMAEIFRKTSGMPLVWCSGQNIDRLVTVFRAAIKSGRKLILDMYTAHILAAIENPRLPQAEWPETRVFLPWSQKQHIIKDESFDIANRYKAGRIYPEQLAGAASTSVMLFRPSMRIDLEKAACLEGACLVYSMWDGYLKDPKMKPFLSWLDDRTISIHHCHTSGHASVKDLKRLREAFGGATVVPIHTQQPDLYGTTFENVQIRKDGEWWEV